MFTFKFMFRSAAPMVQKPKILLIDRDRDIHTLVELTVDIAGVGTLFSATTGLQGIEAARTERPDVILLAMRLPDISGDIVLRALKSHPETQGIPVILFTAFAGDLDSVEHLPYSDIVLKPFCMQRLCAVIRRNLNSCASDGKGVTPSRPDLSYSPGTISSQFGNAGDTFGALASNMVNA